MSRLRVVPIVEGHGEEAALRILLQRVWTELLGGDYVEVLKPIRRSRSSLIRPSGIQEGELSRAIELALLKLHASPSPEPALVLLLLDAEDALPCELAPQLVEVVGRSRPDVDLACVLANVEYETWFVAAAESLGRYLDVDEGEVPDDPEASRFGKGWIEARFQGPKYSESVDQPAMTAAMDLRLCRRRSPSFDKLCRELERRLGSRRVPIPG